MIFPADLSRGFYFPLFYGLVIIYKLSSQHKLRLAAAIIGQKCCAGGEV